MRTITLREHRPSQERLTRSEVEQLLTVRKLVGLAPLAGDGMYELRAYLTIRRAHVGNCTQVAKCPPIDLMVS